MNVMGGGASASLVKAMQAAFEQATGGHIDGEFSAVGAMRDKLMQGAACDLVILTAPLIDTLIASGHVVAGSARSLGLVKTGIAQRTGEPPAVIRDRADLAAALRGASGIYFPDAQKSTAGRHFMGVLRALGLDESLQPVFHQFPNGETAMQALASSPEPGGIGCTQVTEINGTTGVHLTALLPSDFELVTDYTLGICTAARFPDQARVLADLLCGPASAELRRQGGFIF